jgi:hypothetical protein
MMILARQLDAEGRNEIRNLCGRQVPRIQAAQQEVELGRLLEFFRGEDGGFERVAGDDRAVVGYRESEKSCQ